MWKSLGKHMLPIHCNVCPQRNSALRPICLKSIYVETCLKEAWLGDIWTNPQACAAATIFCTFQTFYSVCGLFYNKENKLLVVILARWKSWRLRHWRSSCTGSKEAVERGMPGARHFWREACYAEGGLAHSVFALITKHHTIYFFNFVSRDGILL